MEKKFQDIVHIDDEWEILSNDGFHPVSNILLTVPYEVWTIQTLSHSFECADNHILFLNENKEVYAKDLNVGDRIITEYGLEPVILIYKNPNRHENMFDIEVESKEHAYLGNGILHHNTTVCVCFLTWFILFHRDKNCALLANKGSQAQEIMSRIQTAYLYLPKWMQLGVKEWNKRSITLENGSRLMAAATSSDSVRGQSFACVSGDTKVTIVDDYNRIWYSDIKDVDTISEFQEDIFDTDRIIRYTNIFTNEEFSSKDVKEEYSSFGYVGEGEDFIESIEKYGIDSFMKIE